MSVLTRFLPRLDFRERHEITIAAELGAIFASIEADRLRDDPIAKVAVAIRQIPHRLTGGHARRPFDWEDFVDLGRPEDDATRKSHAFGLIGALWRRDFGLVPQYAVEDFTADHTPGTCKLVFAFEGRSLAANRSLLVTETGVFCPDAATYRRFLPYWLLIRPVSGLLRRRMLRRIRVRAEAMAPSKTA